MPCAAEFALPFCARLMHRKSSAESTALERFECTRAPAMGGSLRLIAEFPEGVAELSSLGELAEPVDAPLRRHGRRAQLTIAHSS